MKGRGKQKLGKIDQHFNSHSHHLAAAKLDLDGFKKEHCHVDKFVDKNWKSDVATIEQE